MSEETDIFFYDMSFDDYPDDVGFKKLKQEIPNVTLEHYKFYIKYEFLLTELILCDIDGSHKTAAPMRMHWSLKDRILAEREYKKRRKLRPWWKQIIDTLIEVLDV